MAKWIINEKVNTVYKGPVKAPVAILDIMQRRGVSEEKFEDFLSSSPRATYDPFLLTDLRQTAELLLTASDEGRRICVFGDYDADGVTSTALLVSVLRNFTDNLTFHIPSRFEEGYGLNSSVLDKLKSDGVDLIITVDCGSTSPDEVEHAKNIGLDIVITDHHTVSGRTPDCLFVNPKREGDKYPFKELSGCGVAFKLAQGILRICRERGDSRFIRDDLNNTLDLVAISTVADVVSLTDENRSLVKYGLRYINARKRKGLKILLDALELDEKELSSENIAFIIAPHINALGRMRSASVGVDLLLGELPENELKKLAQIMVENNIARKNVQDETKRICLEALSGGNCGENFPVILAPDAHEGVAGIVAGNLKESMYRPVVIATRTKRGVLKGTGRSVPGLNMHELLSECFDLFLKFGGHAGACGFSISEENLPVLRARMQLAMERKLMENPDLLTEKIQIEKILDSEEKTLEFAESLKLLEPYGEGNPKPLFAITDAEVVNVFKMGPEGQHARFTLRGKDNIYVECVLFRRADDFSDLLKKRNIISVAGELSVNEYNGKRLQFIVSDIKGEDYDQN